MDQIKNKSLLEKAEMGIIAIIRPPRASYKIESITDVFMPDPLPIIKRIPVEFRNRRFQKIVGSAYISAQFETEETHHCVIYLHGNCGSQMEGRFLVKQMVPRGVSIFLFDFSGSGNSDGEYVSLGYNERKDVVDAIDFLIKSFGFDDFVLWGRSMGAASAVLAGNCDPRIRGIIADSAYSSLTELFESIATKTSIPSMLSGIAIWYISSRVKARAGFSIEDVVPERVAMKADKPLLMGHSSFDSFVPVELGRKIFDAYSCQHKEFIELPDDHNSPRRADWLKRCYKFILDCFEMDSSSVEVDPSSQEFTQHYASFEQMSSAM